MTKLGDEPAFPKPCDECSHGEGPSKPCSAAQPGLTKREWYAGQALAGFVRHPKLANTFTTVILAIQHADALLAELEKERG